MYVNSAVPLETSDCHLVERDKKNVSLLADSVSVNVHSNVGLFILFDMYLTDVA